MILLFSYFVVLISVGNEDAMSLFSVANQKYGQGHYTDAAEKYAKAILLDPHNADFHCNYGSVLVDLYQHKQAEQQYRLALELDPNHASALFNLASLLQETESKLPEVAQLYTHLLEVESGPPSFDALSNLAACYHQLGDLPKSISYYDRAAAAFPTSDSQDPTILASIYEHLGRALLRQYESTRSSSSSAVEATALQERGILALRSALFNDPSNEIAKHMLSAQLAAIGNHDSHERASASVAPEGYVSRIFDDYASTFESSLALLSYRAPTLIASALGKLLGVSPDQVGGQFGTIIDLGCGTGLLPHHLGIAPITYSHNHEQPIVIGIDLSGGMLGQAESKELFQHLFQGEIVHFLRLFSRHTALLLVSADIETDIHMHRKLSGSIIKTLPADLHSRPFDDSFLVTAVTLKKPILYIAADVLVYIGALEGVLTGLQENVREGDYAAFTVESADVNMDHHEPSDGTWLLRSSGRYAHYRSYLATIPSKYPRLDLVLLEPISARREHGVDVKGYLVVLKGRN